MVDVHPVCARHPRTSSTPPFEAPADEKARAKERAFSFRDEFGQ